MLGLFRKKKETTKTIAIPEVEELEARVNFLSEINKAINMKSNRVDVMSQKKVPKGWEIRADINLDPFKFTTNEDGHILKFEEIIPLTQNKDIFGRAKKESETPITEKKTPKPIKAEEPKKQTKGFKLFAPKKETKEKPKGNA